MKSGVRMKVVLASVIENRAEFTSANPLFSAPAGA
jgi:hypothetical protein